MRRHVWSLPLAHPRWLLIGLLMLAGVGCAKRDWVSDLLVLTDVSGTWEGSVNNARFGAHSQAAGNVLPRTPITIVLQQSGPKVTGELSWARWRILAYKDGNRLRLV